MSDTVVISGINTIRDYCHLEYFIYLFKFINFRCGVGNKQNII